MLSLRKTLTALSAAVILVPMFCGNISGQNALTTIQDTLFNADGARYNGTLFIKWSTFDTGNPGTILQQSKSVQVVNGNLLVQLAANSGALPPANVYSVLYQSDGDQQYSETWTVPVSTTALKIPQVRTGSGNGSGGTAGGLTGGTTESTITNLVSDLNARPIKGPGFGVNGLAVIDQNGQIETVVGNPGDCVFVDGTTGPCSSGLVLPTFVNGETPVGLVNGLNPTFTLANAPSGASLQLFRNGILQQAGADFSLNGSTIQFVGGAIPQPLDILVAQYRMDPGSAVGSGPAAGPSGVPGANGCGAVGAISKSAGYQIVPGDNGDLLIQTANANFSLPVSVPPPGWCVVLLDTNSANIAVGNSGNAINGVNASYSLHSGNTISVVSDGSGYWVSGATGPAGSAATIGTLAQRTYTLAVGGTASGGAWSPGALIDTGVGGTVLANFGTAMVFSHSGSASKAIWTWAVDSNWDNTQPVNLTVGGYDGAGSLGNFKFTAQIGCLATGGSRTVVLGNLSAATFTMDVPANYYEGTMSGIDMSHCAAGEIASIIVTRDNTVAGNSADDAAMVRFTLNYSDK